MQRHQQPEEKGEDPGPMADQRAGVDYSLPYPGGVGAPSDIPQIPSRILVRLLGSWLEQGVLTMKTTVTTRQSEDSPAGQGGRPVFQPRPKTSLSESFNRWFVLIGEIAGVPHRRSARSVSGGNRSD